MLQKQAFCTTCQRPSLFVKSQPEIHNAMLIGHAVLTVLTCGLWLLVAIPWAMWQGWVIGRQRYRCQTCGRAG